MRTRATATRLRDANYFLNRAATFQANGKLNDAVKTLRKGLKSHPGNLLLALRLGANELSRGNFEGSIRVLVDALSKNPGQPDVLYHLGFAYLAVGNGNKAQGFLEPVVASHPNYISAQEALGSSLLVQGKHAEALNVSRKAVENRHGGNGLLGLHLNMVIAFQGLSQLDEAADVLAMVKQQLPENTQVLLAEARLHADLGKTPETVACLQRIQKIDPDHIEAFEMLHKIRTRKPDPTALEQIKRFLGDASLSKSNRITLHFVAGEIHDRSGDFGAAFGQFETANNLQREKNGAFDVRSHRRLVKSTKAVFNQELYSLFGDRGSASKRPIFILGMPRSGTSLVEQILASHPDVHGAGERKEIAEISAGLGARLKSDRTYPECVLDLTQEMVRVIAKEYLDRVSQNVPSASQITDKMPLNFPNIGLIHLLFPKALIIHCSRDPIDTCLSCFTNNFGSRLKFSNSLADLAEYYSTYLGLMKHWNAVLDPPVFHLQYEELVTNPGNEIPRLIRYCGLPWNDQCLSPHLASRPVTTASRWQVRRPIYKSAVSRAANYGAHIALLRERLNADCA
jgi:tetratricopeptide (TPR) repeat protein